MTEGAVREGVREHALALDGCEAHSTFEFWLPRFNTRADVAIVGDALQGYEIKTSRDTLKRLPRQIEAYSSVFDFCTAVVAERHLERSMELLPSWWGVIVLNHNSGMSPIREPRPNQTIDAATLVRLLWRDEAYEVLDRLGACPDPGMNRAGLWTQVLALLHLDDLRGVVRNALKSRKPGSAALPTKRFS